MQYFFKKFSKKSFTKTLDKIQKVWYNNAAWCVKETTQTNVCLLKATTPPGVSRFTLDTFGCSLYSSLYTFLCQKSVKCFTFLKSCRDLRPRHARESGVGQGRVGWVSGLQKYFSISLSPHTQTLANPLFSRVYEHPPPQKTPIHFTLSSGNGVESPPPVISRLPYPTLSGTYFTLTLHLFPLQNL